MQEADRKAVWALVVAVSVVAVELSFLLFVQFKQLADQQAKTDAYEWIWECVTSAAFWTCVFTGILTWSTYYLYRETSRLASGADAQAQDIKHAITAMARSADATKEIANETRRIGEAQVRAYVACEGGSYAIHPGGATCWPKFKNTGQSPAQEVTIEACIQILSDVVFESDWEVDAVPPIPAGQVENGMLIFSIPDQKAHSAVLLQADNFTIHGSIYWTDVFGNLQQMLFSLLPNGQGRLDTPTGGHPIRRGGLNATNRAPAEVEPQEENNE